MNRKLEDALGKETVSEEQLPWVSCGNALLPPFKVEIGLISRTKLQFSRMTLPKSSIGQRASANLDFSLMERVEGKQA
jgi:hypothetical protein